MEKEHKNSKFVHSELPILHGSDLLREYTDEQKLLVFKLICSLITKYNVRIIRVGYYDESLDFGEDCDSAERVSFCIFNLELMLKDFFSGNYATVYELDASNLNKIRYNDMQHINQFAQFPCPENFSINIANSLGKFFCEKKNYCMYTSDIAGWLLKKTSDNLPTKFLIEVVAVAKEIEENVLFNKIIFMKKSAK